MIPKILLPRYCKWIGLILYLITFIYAALYSQNDLDDVRSLEGYLIQVFIFVGLLFMLGARLKIEDEFSQHIRLVSLQWAIVIFILYRLIFKGIAYTTSSESWMPQGAD